MSSVEIALQKVKCLSDAEARSLLNWLKAHRRHSSPRKRSSNMKTRTRRSMRQMLAWYDSIRGTTNWEPPRMPDDLVKRITFE